MPWEFPLRIEKRHLLADLPGGPAIVDTGSPMSLALPGAELPFPEMSDDAVASEVLTCIRTSLGLEATYLIGCDILGQSQFLLDLATGYIRAESWTRPSVAFGIGSVAGLPAIKVQRGGNEQWAILDSGAQYSYVPASALDGAQSIGTATDFHPFVGAFEVQLHEEVLTTAVGPSKYICGVLPPELNSLARPTGGWIIGIDFFIDRNLLFDLNEQWLAVV